MSSKRWFSRRRRGNLSPDSSSQPDDTAPNASTEPMFEVEAEGDWSSGTTVGDGVSEASPQGEVTPDATSCGEAHSQAASGGAATAGEVTADSSAVVRPPIDTAPQSTGNPPQEADPLAGEASAEVRLVPGLTLGYGAHPPADSTRYLSLTGVEPRKVLEGVPDTSLDALDLPCISMRAVSVRGRDHRLEGSVRQDSYAFAPNDQTLTCAVADGVGSASHSQIGSRVASHWAAASQELVDHHTRQRRELLRCPQETDLRSQCDLTLVGSQILAEAARLEGVVPEDVATTLVAATIDLKPEQRRTGEGEESIAEWPVTLTSIGDSGFALVRNGEWQRVDVEAGTQKAAEAAAEGDPTAEAPSPELSMQQGIEALPTTTSAQSRTLALMPQDVLILATDGILDIADGVPEFREELAALWRGGDPTMSAILRVADALVKSYSDDRTLIAIRVGAGPHG